MKALVFDFDGVIVDSEASTFRLLQKICTSNGVILPDHFLEARVGKKITMFVEEVFADSVAHSIKQKIIKEFYNEFLSHTTEYAMPIRHTTDFIMNYNGNMKLAIASVGSRASIVRILRAIGIEAKFCLIVSSEDVRNLKPDPEVYIETAKKLDCKTSECAVFEDSLIGVQSGTAAGCKVYVVRNGLNDGMDFATYNVRGFISSAADFESELIGR